MTKKKSNSIVNDFFTQIKKQSNEEKKEILTLDNNSLFANYIDSGVHVLNGIFSGDFFGGWEEGRTTVLAGPEASGKTLLAIHGMRIFLEKYPEDGICYYIETEGRVAQTLATQIPENLRNRVIVEQISTVNELNGLLSGKIQSTLEKLSEKGKTPHMMIVVDSLGNIASDKETKDVKEGNNSKGDYSRTKQIKKLFRTISIPLIGKYKILFLAINHVYDVVGGNITYKKMSGGSGITYLGNNIIEVKRMNTTYNKKSRETNVEEDWGLKTLKIRAKVLKSLSVAKGTQVYILFRNGKFYKYSDILRLANDFKLIKKKTGKLGKRDGAQMYTYITENKKLKDSDDIYTLDFIRKNFIDEITTKVNDEFKRNFSFVLDENTSISDDDNDFEEKNDDSLNNDNDQELDNMDVE